jgi:hypothetical protein
MNTSKDQHMYRHIAAFVDLLGQRKALERFKLFPDMGNPEEVAELESAIEARQYIERLKPPMNFLLWQKNNLED